MPTTVAQFDHDARVIVIPINAKSTQCSKAYTHTRARGLTHAAITETYTHTLRVPQRNMKENEE